MSLEIGAQIVSGQKVWRGTIDNFHALIERSKFDTFRSFKASFQKTARFALGKIEGDILPTVAQLTGLLRADFINSFESNFDIKLSNDYAEAEFLFNVQRFISDLAYARYHLVQDPDFRYPSGYRYPSTPNTFPIDLGVLTEIIEVMRVELIRNMRLWGFDV